MCVLFVALFSVLGLLAVRALLSGFSSSMCVFVDRSGFWDSDCSWWFLMLGMEFRGSVASLALVVSGCRRAFLKFSSPLVVVLLRSLWIVPFPS